jgi:hypothetical protein
MSTRSSTSVLKMNSSSGRSSPEVERELSARGMGAGRRVRPRPPRTSAGMSSGRMGRPGASTTMDSTRLRSSRTLPGQL